MPPSEAAPSKMKKKSAGGSGKATEGDCMKREKKKKDKKKDSSIPKNKIQKQLIKSPPNKSGKSGKASRKSSSSVVSGKVAEIVNPLILNYWNGRGLMEVPRMMLGKPMQSAIFYVFASHNFCSLCGQVSGR
jgi:hypothetical protein